MVAIQRKKILPWLVAWCAVALLYGTLLKVPYSRAYIDFGDGNYQYISWRLTQGVGLYTDILSPQPPFHLWTGAALERLAGVIGCEPLLLYRMFSLLVRLGISAAVGAIAFTLYRSPGTALLASALILLLPEGYRWSQGYQSEHLEILLLCLGFLACLLRLEWSRVLAACLAVGALWTNMSSLPFAILIGICAVFFRPFRWTPILSGILTLAALLGISLWQAGGAYIENVWSNQVASIPTDPRVWLESIRTEGSSIILLEGFFILAALVAMFEYLDRKPSTEEGFSPTERGLIVLYAIASIGSAGYVVKGGTVDYIFVLAEPAVAVFAARSLVMWFGRSEGVTDTSWVASVLRPACRVLILVGTIVLLAWNPFSFIKGVRLQGSPGVDLPNTYEGRIVEFSDWEVRTIERIIAEISEPGDTIWAPPFFAALTKRPIAMDLSETYLWYVRWQRSVWGKVDDPAVDVMISGITDLLERCKIPVLLLNSRTGQWGQLIVPDLTLRLPSENGPSRIVKIRDLDPRLDRLQSTLEKNYHPILSAPGEDSRLYLQGMNERLEIWVPKERSPYLPPWSQIGF